jgi:DNA-binding CsgD family transcriptional regulator
MDRQSVLLEREPELALIAELVELAQSRTGCVLAIEGPAGIGKTALLRVAEERASKAGFRVLSARGGELERELAFGVVRQLLESAVASLPPGRQDEVLAGAAALARRPLGLAPTDDEEQLDSGAALHGLYWLMVNLSDDRPTLLVIDDLQWCDTESLSWLVYMGRRLRQLPLLVSVAVRVGEGVDVPEGRGLFGLLLDEPVTRSARPRPLGPGAVTTLVRQTFGAGAEEGFSRACLALTAGNPFAVGALLAAVRDEGLVPTAASTDRLERLGAAAIADAALVRIARLGRDAGVIAQAIAVLGAGARLHDAAVLAEVSEPDAGAAADALRRVGILRGSVELEFDHPLLRAAVYRDIPMSSRAVLHKRAAQLLAGRSADGESVVAQLLASEPAGDHWVVEQLVRAARRAAVAGAPTAASIYLERAWREPPVAELRTRILHELAVSETAAGSLGAEAHFRKALELADSAQERVRVALDLALLLSHSNRPGVGVDVLAGALDGLGDADRELGLLGESALCGIALLDLGTLARASERLARQPPVSGVSPGERALLATRSIESVMSGESADATAATALAALADGRLLAEVTADSQLFYLAGNALVLTDRLAQAREALDAAVVDAGRRGSVMGFVLATCWRANALLKAGSVRDAEADARASIEAASQAGLQMLAHFALAFLLDALLELGRADEAQGELSQSGLTGELPNLHHYTTLLDSRGRVRMARDDLQGGLSDFLECGRRQLAWGFPNPAPMAWRSNAARAHARIGSIGDPAELAREELTLARKFGANRPIAVALRALAAVGQPEARCERLREAERVVRDTDARLEHAHALVELGAELRRGNQRREARAVLLAGLSAADRCGTIALSTHALEELAASGARPRRMQLSGVAALTASERRVAQMAARGATNPEIAQALFVTRATVESHLHAAYRKLSISSRNELAGELEPGDPLCGSPGREG